MSATIIDHALKSSVRIVRVIIARYREDSPRSERPLITHWGRVTHICVSNLTIIGSDNGLSPHRRQAIICTNAGILLIAPLGTNFNENLIGIQTFSFYKMHFKMSSAKWRPFCLGLNVISSGHPGCAKAPWGPKSARLSVGRMFKCIPFNGSAEFWQRLCL